MTRTNQNEATRLLGKLGEATELQELTDLAAVAVELRDKIENRECECDCYTDPDKWVHTPPGDGLPTLGELSSFALQLARKLKSADRFVGQLYGKGYLPEEEQFRRYRHSYEYSTDYIIRRALVEQDISPDAAPRWKALLDSHLKKFVAWTAQRMEELETARVIHQGVIDGQGEYYLCLVELNPPQHGIDSCTDRLNPPQLGFAAIVSPQNTEQRKVLQEALSSGGKVCILNLSDNPPSGYCRTAECILPEAPSTVSSARIIPVRKVCTRNDDWIVYAPDEEPYAFHPTTPEQAELLRTGCDTELRATGLVLNPHTGMLEAKGIEW